MFAVVVTGPPGAGKTACLTALTDALVDDKIAHASLDMDEVAWAYPFPSDRGARGSARQRLGGAPPDGP